jgi:hypothetical protein
MKSFKLFCPVLIVVLFSSVAVMAQATGDFKSIATGVWSATSTWQTYNGSTWVSASSAPTGSEVITVQSVDSVNVDVLVTISDTLKNQGKLGGTGNLTIASGGVYQHDQNNGSLPVCTWDDGSLCLVTGYITGSKPSNANQNFYSFGWECSGQTANTDLSMSGNTIRGDFTVKNTGSGRVYITSPAAYSSPVTINGNIYVTGGTFSSNGSGSSATIEVYTHGNIIVTGGNFGMSRGSAPDVYWRHYGDFSVTNATLQNSGTDPKVQKLIFANVGGEQNITLENVTYGASGSTPFTIQVDSGATLNMGTTEISSGNTGSFILLPGATLATGNPAGINGCIQCTGASAGGGNVFSPEANYVFNGTTAQVTGMLMPTTVNSLTINNSAGVILTQGTTINGVLHLVAGVFDNTIPFTLGPSGSISYEGGSLLVPVSVDISDELIPQSFFVDQNYPNPFNPSTEIRFGLPTESFVTVKIFDALGQEVTTLFEGNMNAGIHNLQFAPSKLSSGVYLYRVQTDHNVDVRSMMFVK